MNKMQINNNLGDLPVFLTKAKAIETMEKLGVDHEQALKIYLHEHTKYSKTAKDNGQYVFNGFIPTLMLKDSLSFYGVSEEKFVSLFAL